MCLSPITIPNPTKYVSTSHADQFLLQVPCGHCAECQSMLSNQWFFRAWYEFEECLNSSPSNFCYFDTLTYDETNLPHMSDFMQVEVDYPCFNRQHLHLFLDSLDKRLSRRYHSEFRYFISSEYGTRPRDGKTYRPHYHILLFVYGKIDPLDLSAEISDLWKYGRTDGKPWKTNTYILDHNVIRLNSSNLGHHLRTCQYVAKYVQKSCIFDREINKRISSTLYNVALSEYAENADDWLASEDCRRLRLKLKRMCNSFHLQSQKFGLSALRDVDLNELFENGCLYMPSFKTVKVPVPLSTYYKRKLFYEQVELDGSRYWQLTALGKDYKKARESDLLKRLTSRFSAYCEDANISDIDCVRLAEYVYKSRGRILGHFPESTLEERLDYIDLYAYLTCTDKALFGKRGFVTEYKGNAQVGYITDKLGASITIPAFISQFVCLDGEREKELNRLYAVSRPIGKGKQEAYELKQHLTNLYKFF